MIPLTYLRKAAILVPLLVLLTSAGCTEKGAAPTKISMAQVPEAMEKVFRDAQPEIRQRSDAALAALNQKEADKALFILQELTSQPKLTAKQRQVAASSMLAVNAEVQSAAASGDANAAAMVQYRRISK
jgi:hypothetical protein